MRSRRARLPRPAGPGGSAAPPAVRVAADRWSAIGARLPSRLRGGAADALAGRRVVFAAAGFAAGLMVVRPPGGIGAAAVGAIVGVRAANAVAERRERRRRQTAAAGLPDVVDLLAVCVLGGMGLDAALRRVAAAAGGPLADALARAVAALDAGLRWDDALAVFAERAGCEEAAAFAAALRRAARYGAPLAATLVAQAADARAAARDRAREHALGAPVRMLFPLTLCFLPAFVLLAVAPSLLVAIRSLAER